MGAGRYTNEVETGADEYFGGEEVKEEVKNEVVVRR
jgi:hypothetical protein